MTDRPRREPFPVRLAGALAAYFLCASLQSPFLVGKIRTLDTDGPAGMCSPTLGMFGTGYCCNMIISQSWNRQLAYDAAQGIAQEFYDFGVVGWYAPSMNIHRSAFAGRNFEYYSEDGFLSGELAREQIKACENTPRRGGHGHHLRRRQQDFCPQLREEIRLRFLL